MMMMLTPEQIFTLQYACNIARTNMQLCGANSQKITDQDVMLNKLHGDTSVVLPVDARVIGYIPVSTLNGSHFVRCMDTPHAQLRHCIEWIERQANHDRQTLKPYALTEVG